MWLLRLAVMLIHCSNKNWRLVKWSTRRGLVKSSIVPPKRNSSETVTNNEIDKYTVIWEDVHDVLLKRKNQLPIFIKTWCVHMCMAWPLKIKSNNWIKIQFLNHETTFQGLTSHIWLVATMLHSTKGERFCPLRKFWAELPYISKWLEGGLSFCMLQTSMNVYIF